MNKFCVLLSASLFCVSATAQTFGKGDMVLDLGIGVGCADNVEMSGKFPNYSVSKSSGATFTQKVAFEFGVAEFNKSSIGVGLIVSNAYGASYDGVAAGEYDYKYAVSHYHYTKNKGGRYLWQNYQTTSEHRKGVGVAKATYAVDNVDILVKGSFHHQFVNKLDTYATLGLGASIFQLICSADKDETQGFSSRSETLDRSQEGGYQLVYNYDDMSHAKWSGTDTKARFAMALFVGARYYFNAHWAVNAELGLTSASFKKDANTYNIFSVGASYNF